METNAEPKHGWKDWFAEKKDREEIISNMALDDKEKTQEQMTRFLIKTTKIKIRLDNAMQRKKECESRAAELSPKPNQQIEKITEELAGLRDEIKTSKKHLESTLEKIAIAVSKMFSVPDFNKMDLCNNGTITIGVKNELEWEFDGTCRLPKECFLSKKDQLKKAINSWVKTQFSMGKLDIDGIKTTPRLKAKATLKKNRSRG